MALAWRLTNRPPTIRPNDNDPDLESLIVRIQDGAILAKSTGFYWHLGDRYAPRQYLHAAWSPDSRFLIRTAGRVGVADSAELFAFAEDDRVIGPFDLAKLIDTAVRAQIKGVEPPEQWLLSFAYKPEITIDEQGLIRASIYMRARNQGGGPIYDLTAMVIGSPDLLDAKVLSISQYLGPSVSVTVH